MSIGNEAGRHEADTANTAAPTAAVLSTPAFGPVFSAAEIRIVRWFLGVMGDDFVQIFPRHGVSSPHGMLDADLLYRIFATGLILVVDAGPLGFVVIRPED